MKKQNKNNYFKGLTKSPKQLCNSLKKYIEEVIKNIEGYADTCEYHLEQENCKKYNEYANIQDACEDLKEKLEDSYFEIEGMEDFK